MDWGAQPPSYYEVLFSNSSLPPFSPSQLSSSSSSTNSSSSSDDGDVRNVTSGTVQISSPWDPVTAYEIKTYVGNQTNVTLPGVVWSGRYAHLGIRGNQVNGSAGDESASAGAGGTVAEWNLVREGYGYGV